MPDERAGDFAEVCALLHAWHNARTAHQPGAVARAADHPRHGAESASRGGARPGAQAHAAADRGA